jgi:uncharacterized protein YihD (DUF1040 family)
MTKKELEDKVTELLEQNKGLARDLNNANHDLQLAQQGGGHTAAYDELMDKAITLQKDGQAQANIITGLQKTLDIIRAALK